MWKLFISWFWINKINFHRVKIFKKHPSVLKIIFQRGMYNMTTGEAIKNELKVAIPFSVLYKIHQLMIRYHTPWCQWSTMIATHWIVDIMSVILLIPKQEFSVTMMMTISLKLERLKARSKQREKISWVTSFQVLWWMYLWRSEAIWQGKSQTSWRRKLYYTWTRGRIYGPMAWRLPQDSGWKKY